MEAHLGSLSSIVGPLLQKSYKKTKPHKKLNNQAIKNKHNKTKNIDAAAGCLIILVFSSCYSPYEISIRLNNNFSPLNTMHFMSSFNLQTAQAIVGVRFATTTVTAQGLVTASLATAPPTTCPATWWPFVRKVRLVINDRMQIRLTQLML